MLTRSISKLRLCSPAPSSRLQHMTSSPAQDCRLLLLPEEMFHHLLGFLSLPDCGQLCLASRQTRDLVVSWVVSPRCLSRLTAGLTGVTSSRAKLELWLSVSRQFGLFCKRASMLWSSWGRLASLTHWFSGLEQLGCAGLTFRWEEVCRKMGLAAALHSLSLGWDESEWDGILTVLEHKFPVLRRLGHIVSGVQDWEMSQLRAVLRIFFWEFAPDEATQASWLVCIMKRFASTVCRDLSNTISIVDLYSSLMFFMLGCTESSAVSDFSNCSFQQSVLGRLLVTPDPVVLQDEVLTDSYSEAKQVFGDLGQAFRVLDSNKHNMNLDMSLYGLMSSLFHSEDWDRDNTAACLLFSSESVVSQFLTGLLADGEKQRGLERMAEILVAMLVVCERLGNRLNQGLTNILDFVFIELSITEANKKKLISEFWREIGERLEDDIGLDIIVQLGVHLGLKDSNGVDKVTSVPSGQTEE
jgi:hypothetical protein